MFKFETIVKGLLFTICLATAAASAEDKSSSSQSTSSSMSLVNKADDGVKKALTDEMLRLKCFSREKANDFECNEMKKEIRNATDQNLCEEAVKEFNEAKSQFSEACSEANVSTEGHPTIDGNQACGYAMARCDCLTSTNTEYRNKMGCGANDKLPRSSSTKGPDMAAARRKFRYCPQIATQDIGKHKEKAEKAEERIKELEDKLPSAREEAMKAQNDGLDEVSKIDEEVLKATNKHEEDKAQDQLKKSETQKRLEQEIMQMLKEIGVLEEQMGQLELSKTDAEMKRSETVTQVELNCHSSAHATVGQEQALFFEQIRQGKARLGGQSDIMKKVGASSDQHWQRRANELYNKCLNSTPTARSKESAKKVFDMAITTANKTKADLRKRRAQLEDAMKKVKDPNGQCGQVIQKQDGSNNETEMCRAAREAIEAEIRKERAFFREQYAMEQKKAAAIRKADQNYKLKIAEVNRINGQIAEERTKLRGFEQYLDAAAQAGVSEDSDSKAFQKVKGKFSSFNSAARKVEASCGPNCTSGVCKTAKAYSNLMSTSSTPTDARNSDVQISDVNEFGDPVSIGGQTPSSSSTGTQTPSSSGGASSGPREKKQ